LKQKIINTIEQNITYDDFIDWFEEWYCDSILDQLNPKLADDLEVFYLSVGYYVSNASIRQDHPSYYGDEVFIYKLNSLLMMLR